MKLELLSELWYWSFTIENITSSFLFLILEEFWWWLSLLKLGFSAHLFSPLPSPLNLHMIFKKQNNLQYVTF